MTGRALRRGELCWAGVVLGQMALVSIAWVMVALLYDLSVAPDLLRRWGLWVEGAAWFTLAFSAPLVLAVATVLVGSGLRGAGFSSRRQRLCWHLLAALLGALGLAGMVSRLSPEPHAFGAGFVIVTAAAWVVLFPMLYVPRLVAPRLAGLEPSARTPATPSSPR